MAADTFQSIWSKVLLRCPLAGPALAQDWVRNSYRRLAERRTVGWSWELKFSQFLFNPLVKAGTVSLVFNNPTVTGTGTAFDQSMVGRQFRLSTQTPIYTILSVDNGAQTLTLTLDGQNPASWGGNTVSGSGYQIYNAYQTAPADFKNFIAVIDPLMNWRLWLNVQKPEIDLRDPQRATLGPSYAVVNNAYDAMQTIPAPRFEFWPHQQNQYVLQYMYTSRPPDLDDTGATLPTMVRGDVLLEMALSEAAEWPGPSADKKSAYYDLDLYDRHVRRAEQLITELEVRDDDIYEQDVTYQEWMSFPLAPYPILDARFLQSHSI